MGNQVVSRFSDKLQWTTLSKKGCKEVIQSKSTKQVVERYTLEHIDPDEIKRQSLIYEWRTHKKAEKFTVAIQEMKYIQIDDEPDCFYHFCHRTQPKNHKLLIYTEQIHKLYENNCKFHFNQVDQIRLFTEIFRSVEQLSQKFGYFMISKQMIGYNSKMVGKAWINENFASNYVQYKRQVHTKNDRQKWQGSIIQNVIDICRLCTTQMASRTNKFEFVIMNIRQNRLFTFDLFSKFSRKMNGSSHQELQPRESQSLKKKISSEKHSYKANSNNEFSNSKQEILNSKGKQQIKEVISSTKDCKDTKVIKEKRFVMVPVVNIKKIYHVSEQERVLIDDRIRHSERLAQDYRQNSLMISPLRQNYVEVQRHTQSFIRRSNEKYQIKSEICQPLDSILQISQKNAQQFNEVSDIIRDSSGRSSSREAILMVDSMIVVEKQDESDQLTKKNTKIILEQSIILRGQSE